MRTASAFLCMSLAATVAAQAQALSGGQTPAERPFTIVNGRSRAKCNRSWEGKSSIVFAYEHLSSNKGVR